MRLLALALALEACGPPQLACDADLQPRPKFCPPLLRASVVDAGATFWVELPRDAGPLPPGWQEVVTRCTTFCTVGDGPVAAPVHVCWFRTLPGEPLAAYACLCRADLPDGGWSC